MTSTTTYSRKHPSSFKIVSQAATCPYFHTLRESPFLTMLSPADYVVPNSQQTPTKEVHTVPSAPTMHHNLLHPLPSARTAEVFETILSIPHGRLERIVSHGQASPPGFWYDQPEQEWVFLLQGAARLGWEHGPPTELSPGDCVLIPAGTKHRVEWTTPDEPTVWLALFFKAAIPD